MRQVKFHKEVHVSRVSPERRYGLYGAWPLYADGVDTVQYRIGTANVDVVDAERDQLIREGVAEGRLTQEVMDNPRQAIADVVAELFSRYPVDRPIERTRAIEKNTEGRGPRPRRQPVSCGRIVPSTRRTA